MKVYTRITYQWDKELGDYVEESSDSYEYEGPVAEAKGSGRSESTTATTDPWEGQQPYLRDLFQQAQSYATSAPSDTSASSALTGQAVESYGQASGALQDYLNPIFAANQQYATGQFLDPSSNPAFQQYMDLSNQSIGKQYTEGFLPQLTGGAVQAGNVGSSRQGVAEAVGGGKYLDAIQRNSAQLTNQAYGQGLQATMQAQGLSQGFAGLFDLPAELQTRGASLQYGLDTQADAARRERLQAYQRLISGSYGGTTTQEGPGYQTGGLSGALGGAATGYSVGGGYGAAIGAVAGYFS